MYLRQGISGGDLITIYLFVYLFILLFSFLFLIYLAIPGHTHTMVASGGLWWRADEQDIVLPRQLW